MALNGDIGGTECISDGTFDEKFKLALPTSDGLTAVDTVDSTATRSTDNTEGCLTNCSSNNSHAKERTSFCYDNVSQDIDILDSGDAVPNNDNLEVNENPDIFTNCSDIYEDNSFCKKSSNGSVEEIYELCLSDENSRDSENSDICESETNEKAGCDAAVTTLGSLETDHTNLTDNETTMGRNLRKRKKDRDKAEDCDDSGIASGSTSANDEHDILKAKSILALLRSAEPDREKLKQQTISRGGLVNNEMRRLAWPVLLDVDVSDIYEKPDEETLHSHRDYEQVVLDVNRSLKRFPPGMEETERMAMQDQLVDCIMRVLCARPELHYYQGYHDIVVTFLLVVGEDITFALMNELSVKHLRDFMYESMDKTTGMLHYLYPLLGKTNPKLRHFMEKAEVGTIFSLPWLITWYGHVLGDIRHIVRLYDFFIACHPLMPIYLAAAIVLYRGEEILCSEPEMPIIHCLLSRIPPDLPIEQLISEAGDLFLLHPPHSVEQEANAQYKLYLEENERKKKQLNKLRSARRRQSWPLIGQRPSVLVRLTVWTGAALLSAAAVTYITNVYLKTGFDTGFDLHWLWGS